MYEDNKISHDEYMRLSSMSLGSLCIIQHHNLANIEISNKNQPGKFIGFH